VPTIVTRGLGYGELSITFTEIASRLVGTVTVENGIIGKVSVSQNIIGYLVEEGSPMNDGGNRIVMFLRDDRTLAVSANYQGGGAANLTGAKLWFTVKNKASDADADALIVKKNALAGGSDTDIKITDPVGGAAEVYLVPDDTDLVTPGIYSYDVQVMLANEKTYTIVRDRITFKEDVTKAKT